MRKVATVPPAMAERTGMTRLMLVTNPQPSPYREPDAAIVFVYMSAEPDGPSFTAWPFPDADEAVAYLKEQWAVAESDWKVIPDQVPGCQDDWIAPVRVKRTPGGECVYHEWQRLSPDGAWEDLPDPSGPYGLQIAAPVPGLPSMSTLDQAAKELFTRLEQSKGPVLLYFFSPGDEISQKYAAVIDEVERERSGVFAVWRVDNLQYCHACVELRPGGIPSLILFVDGKEVARPPAVWDAIRVLTSIDEVLARSMSGKAGQDPSRR